MKRISSFRFSSPRLRLWALVVLPHLRVAGLVQDQARPARCASCSRSGRASARNAAMRSESALRALPRELLRLHDLAGGLIEGDRARPRASSLTRRTAVVAEAALGHVDDALELQVVGGVEGDLQVGDGVLDLLALIEAGARRSRGRAGRARRSGPRRRASGRTPAPGSPCRLRRVAGLLQRLDVLGDRGALPPRRPTCR